MWDKSIVPPVGRTYIFKTALGMKFFLVNRCLTGVLNTKISENYDLFKPELKLKEEFKIKEIYIINYTSHNDTLTYVFKGVDEIDAYINENNLTDKVERTEYNGKVSYYIDSEEYDIIRVKDNIPVMIKFKYHNGTEASDYVSYINKDADGSYNFIMMFCNGGTDLSEMISDELQSQHLI